MADIVTETETTLARRYRVEVDVSATGTPSWAVVPGVAEFTPKIDPTDQESTDYGSDGWGKNTRVKLQWSAELSLLRRAHPVTGAFNAAQEKLRLASKSFGSASYVHVRWYDRDGREEDNIEGTALVTWEADGGDSEALESIKVTLTGDGAPTYIPNPLG